MKNKRLLLLGAAVGALFPGLVHAQTNARVVSVCAVQTYTVGQSYPLTQNPVGQLCDTGGSGGGGSGGNVTITSPTGTGPTSQGVTVTLDATDASALQSIITGINSAIAAGNATTVIGGVGLYANPAGTPVGVKQGTTTNAIAINGSTTQQIIALSGSTVTYITALSILGVSAADNITIEYGTGTNCSSVVGYLAGNATIPAATMPINGGFVITSGLGPAMVVPAGDETCLVNTAGNAGGFVTFVQQ